MDATFRPRHFSAALFSYAENKKIFEIFKNILEKLCVDRPEKPAEYVYNLLIKEAVYDAPRVFLLGPPFVDRTLVATTLALKIDLMHITRESLLTDDINESINTIDLVKLAKNRLEKPDCARKGWILEGFPRTRTEAFFLRKEGIFPTHIVLIEPHGLLEMSLDVLIEPHDFLEMNLDEMSDEIQDYLGQKALILDFHRNSYWRKFEIGSNINASVDKVIEFVRSKMQPPMPYLPRVLLLGPYGSGRKTVAKKLAEKYNLVLVDYHQELRKAAMKDSPSRKEMSEILQTSSPIPDDLLVEVASERLMRRDCIESGWIMYNFPDTVNQAEKLTKSLEGFQVNRAVFLDASLEVCLDRVQPRRLDPVTGEVYHLKLGPCEDEEVKRRLMQLPQDSEEIVKAEYRFFAENGEQLKLFFQQWLADDISVEVNADLSEYDTFEAVQGAILKSTKKKLFI